MAESSVGEYERAGSLRRIDDQTCSLSRRVSVRRSWSMVRSLPCTRAARRRLDETETGGKEIGNRGELSTQVRYLAPQSRLHAAAKRGEVHAGKQHESEQLR